MIAHADGLCTDVIKLYFEMYEDLLVKNSVAQQPHRIFIVDKTGLNTNPNLKRSTQQSLLKIAI